MFFMLLFLVFFFFKQKTAYEMRISDWSSDVCSSDLNFIVVSDVYPTVTTMAADLVLPAAMWVEKEGAYVNAERRTHVWRQLVEIGRASCRERVCQYV